MKNVKLFFSILMLLILATTACRKDDFYEYEPEGDEWISDDDFDGGTEDDEGALTLYEIVGGDIIKMKDFNVSNNLKPFQADTEKHLQMWEFFKKLIPDHDRRFIVEYEVFHGEGELLGYVTPINDNDLSRWKMGLAIDAAEGLNKVDLRNDFAYTCIHEFAHVFTLNDLQVDISTAERNCENYFTGEGCSSIDSYINRIFEIGWADIIDEFNRVESQDDADRFYEKYEDRFVTDYAATNPGEDVAEVFTMFVVMNDRPTGRTIADQKILAMYDYPELVELRKVIRDQPVLRTLAPGGWVKKGKKHNCRHAHHKHSAKAQAF